MRTIFPAHGSEIMLAPVPSSLSHSSRAHHATFAARGLSPLLYETDLGGEFSGDAWDGAVLAVGAHHETRAPEAHGRRRGRAPRLVRRRVRCLTCHHSLRLYVGHR